MHKKATKMRIKLIIVSLATFFALEASASINMKAQYRSFSALTGVQTSKTTLSETSSKITQKAVATEIVYITRSNRKSINAKYKLYSQTFTYKKIKTKYSNDTLTKIMQRSHIDAVLIRAEQGKKYTYYFLRKPSH